MSAYRWSALQINGAPSTDKVHGWGPPGGFVYQKGYVEFFCSADTFARVVDKLRAHPTASYMAASRDGEVFASATATTALAWGAFALKEVVQPYVVSPAAFLAWKDEAFALWGSMWGAVAGDAGQAMLREIQGSWLLVSVLENDFASGDVFAALL
jgi:methylenetetrahydrofolate reductase (NADPH)